MERLSGHIATKGVSAVSPLVVALCALFSARGAPVVAESEDRIETYERTLEGRIVGLTRAGLSVREGARLIQVPSADIKAFAWSKDLLVREAEAAFRQRRWTVAEQKLLHVARVRGVAWLRARLLAERRFCLQMLGRREEAAKVLAEIVADAPEAFLEGGVALPADSLSAKEDLAALKAGAGRARGDAFVTQAVRTMLLCQLGDVKSARALRSDMAADANPSRKTLIAVVTARIALAQEKPGAALDALAEMEISAPPALRGQVHFWHATALERSARTDEALFAYLKVGLLYPERWSLAPEALTRACVIAKAAGRPTEAETLRTILVKEFPFSRQATAVTASRREQP